MSSFFCVCGHLCRPIGHIEFLSLLHVSDGDTFTVVSKGSRAVWKMTPAMMELIPFYRFVVLLQILSFHLGRAIAVHVFLWQVNECAIN